MTTWKWSISRKLDLRAEHPPGQKHAKRAMISLVPAMLWVLVFSASCARG